MTKDPRFKPLQTNPFSGMHPKGLEIISKIMRQIVDSNSSAVIVCEDITYYRLACDSAQGYNVENIWDDVYNYLQKTGLFVCHLDFVKDPVCCKLRIKLLVEIRPEILNYGMPVVVCRNE